MLIIRKLEAGDFEKRFLMTLGNLSTVGNVSREKFLEVFEKRKKSSFYRTFVAELDGQVVGTATLLLEQKFSHSGGKVAHVEDMVVRKGYEGQGVGTELLRQVLEAARKEGCYKAILDCSEANVSFYKKAGFRRHEVGMRLDL